MASQYQPQEAYNIDPKAFAIIKALGKESSKSLSDVCELMHDVSSTVKKQQLEIQALRGTVEGLKLNRMKKIGEIQDLRRKVNEMNPCAIETFDDDAVMPLGEGG
jgi:hypothetical protein